VFAENMSTTCSDMTGDRYNGKRVRAWVYYYDAYGYADVNAVIFQHITPDQIPLNAWEKWNNAYATNPYWPTPPFQPWLMNNLTAGGVPIGRVASIGSQAPASCATGAHVHQEVYAPGREPDWDRSKWAEGCFAQAPAAGQAVCPWNSVGGVNWKWISGSSVTGRFSNAHNLKLNVRN
jgi:hypothetical protein